MHVEICDLKNNWPSASLQSRWILSPVGMFSLTLCILQCTFVLSSRGQQNSISDWQVKSRGGISPITHVLLRLAKCFAFQKQKRARSLSILVTSCRHTGSVVLQEVEKSDPKNVNCLPARTRSVFALMASQQCRRAGGRDLANTNPGHSQITSLIWPENSDTLTRRFCIQLREGGEKCQQTCIYLFF